jgi:tetratricopeptide (TPR) repeat protein
MDLSSAGRKLSVAMIARDAEATISAALESVRAIADEIVVVDTGSTDRTRELAQKGASKVFDFRWCDDFAAARNFALGQLTGDWVLWLDASEQLEEKSANAIREYLDLHADASKAYLLNVLLPIGPEQMDGEQAARLRMWPLKSGLRFAGRVREQLSPPLESLRLIQETTDWRIYRSKQVSDLQIKAVKAQRDIQLAEIEIDETGERPELLVAVGDAWAVLNEPLKAAGWFRRAVDDSPRGSTQQLEAYYGLLTTFDSRPGTRDQQISTCLEALEVLPLDSQLHCAMGGYLQAQGRLDLASRSYQMAVEHGTVDVQTWHLTNLADLATICLSMAYELQDRADEARRCVESGLALRAKSERLRRRLIELHVKHNRRQEAISQLEYLPGPISQRDPLRNAIRGACMGAQQQWTAALPYLQTAYAAGCRDPFCLRWLAIGLMNTGEMQTAEAVLGQWRAVSPGNPEPAQLLLALRANHSLRVDEQPAARPPTPTFQILGAPHSLSGGATFVG